MKETRLIITEEVAEKLKLTGLTYEVTTLFKIRIWKFVFSIDKLMKSI